MHINNKWLCRHDAAMRGSQPLSLEHKVWLMQWKIIPKPKWDLFYTILKRMPFCKFPS